jgi:predicted dithiol-disulfide oxidoreductase (DUF899 family)
MKDFMSAELGVPKVVDRSTFQAELDALRVREKVHAREGDAIAAARRRLPMVAVDGATPLTGERGAVTLLDALVCSTRRITRMALGAGGKGRSNGGVADRAHAANRNLDFEEVLANRDDSTRLGESPMDRRHR